MAKNLKKFVNPKFTGTIGLEPMRRLLERHRDTLPNFDFGIFDGAPAPAREAIQAFFAGPDPNYPDGLVKDLHRIAELGTREGLRILIEQARRLNVTIGRASEADLARMDPKHVALSTFLEHPVVFEEASNLLTYFLRASLAEFGGAEGGIEARLEEETQGAFRRGATPIFEADLHGRYCKVDWFEDDGDVNLIVGYGAPVAVTPVIQEGAENVICFQAVDHAVLCYTSNDGRLKIGGIAKARQEALAELFAVTILGRPGFFAKPDARRLYTLEPIERDWPNFRFTHAFDPMIRGLRIIEAQADHVSLDLFGQANRVDWSITTRGRDECALSLLRGAHPSIHFGSDASWRLGHVVIRVDIDAGERRPARVTVKVKPTAQLAFRRQRFEGQIMALLQRNGFCSDRDADRAAVAAE